MHKNTVPVGVLGASGYVGRELLALLEQHAGVRIAFATSESESDVFGVSTIQLDAAAERWGESDLVLSCLPHGVSGPAVADLRTVGVRVIDLSADYRMSDEAVYGLTEVHRRAVAEAELVANPGCYPTAALLALLPLARQGWIDAARPIVVHAASGVTGAGRSPRRHLLFAEVAEDFRAYAVENEHHHVRELAAGLAPWIDGADVLFTPHLLPVRRGILATIHAPVRCDPGAPELQDLYRAAYEAEPCVRVFDRIPSLRDVVHRNRVALAVRIARQVRAPTVTIVAAVDNLMKGAAGQAVQNMNVMLKFHETRGLAC